MVSTTRRRHRYIITLMPNCSASWQQIKWVMLVITLITLTVAVMSLMVGAWPVVPFAGLELGLLYYFSYKVAVKTHTRQVITVGKKVVRVEQGTNKPERQWVFKRRDTLLNIEDPHSPADLIHLRLKDDAQQVEIGAFLNQQEKDATRDAIKQSGVIECHSQWWKHA